MLSFPLAQAFAQTQKRVIIDTDPGVDDAFAILLALNSPELKVEALTVVPGNVEGKQGLENALKIVSLANRCDVAVAGGAQHPLNQKLITAQYWHGRNGMAGGAIPPTQSKTPAPVGAELTSSIVPQKPHAMSLTSRVNFI